jgi:hypothetical protein
VELQLNMGEETSTVHMPRLFSSIEMKVPLVTRKIAQKSDNSIQTQNSLNERPVFYPKTNSSPLSYYIFPYSLPPLFSCFPCGQVTSDCVW